MREWAHLQLVTMSKFSAPAALKTFVLILFCAFLLIWVCSVHWEDHHLNSNWEFTEVFWGIFLSLRSGGHRQNDVTPHVIRLQDLASNHEFCTICTWTCWIKYLIFDNFIEKILHQVMHFIPYHSNNASYVMFLKIKTLKSVVVLCHPKAQRITTWSYNALYWVRIQNILIIGKSKRLN